MRTRLTDPLRVCLDCGLEAYTEEDLDLFAKNKSSKYGRRNLCGKCHNMRWRKYRATNRQKIGEQQRKRRAANPVKWKKYHRKYYAANPFQLAINYIKGRSKKKGLSFDLTKEYLEQLWNECGGICPMTGIKMKKSSNLVIRWERALTE